MGTQKNCLNEMFLLSTQNIIKSNGLFQLRAQEGQTIEEEILHTMINDDTYINNKKKGKKT